MEAGNLVSDDMDDLLKLYKTLCVFVAAQVPTTSASGLFLQATLPMITEQACLLWSGDPSASTAVGASSFLVSSSRAEMELRGRRLCAVQLLETSSRVLASSGTEKSFKETVSHCLIGLLSFWGPQSVASERQQSSLTCLLPFSLSRCKLRFL